MFYPARWTDAFLAVSGKDADEAFSCLKALVPPVKSAHGIFFGNNASVQLEKILRESVIVAGGKDGKETNPALEHAIRFICLLVEKKCFNHIDILLNRLERILDEKKGFLYVKVQVAAPVDGDAEKELAESIKRITGASGIKMETQVRPELLGGYLLRIGDFYVDASLKGQLEKMTAELVFDGGNNGKLQ
ncbi:MAG: F0F1 ATP synthase subunit delta [Treponema sp.]|nr:F0F1 ATP synthase subunit delta [Treponema sp.]